MRILRVAGRNLASLSGAFEIDLETGPLGAAGLFAITGPTGSGKSTLLDAICLALYDRLPRLQTADRRAEVARGSADEGLSSTDVRGILRHGTSHGCAEVDFVGQDGHSYRATWSVRRARNRANGALQLQTLGLVRLDTGTRLGGTKTETLAEIQRRVGLDFQQFCRAVLLAQGDFDAFIKAGPEQRSELLERITGTAIYTELSKAAHRRAREANEHEKELATRLGEHRTLDAPSRAALDASLAGATADVDRLAGVKAQVEGELAWYTEDDKLAGLLAAQEAQHRAAFELDAASEGERAAVAVARRAIALAAEHRKALDAARRVDAYAARVRELGQARAAAEQVHEAAAQQSEAAARAAAEARDAFDAIGPDLTRATEMDALILSRRTEFAGRSAALQAAEAERATSRAARQASEVERERALGEVVRREQWLAVHAADAELADRLETVVRDLEQCVRLQTGIDDLESLATQADDDAREAAERARAADEEAETQASVRTTLEPEAQALRDAVGGLDRKAILAAQSDAQAALAAAGRCLDAAKDGLENAEAATRARAALDESLHAAETCERTRTEAERELPLVRARCDEARRGFELSAAAHDEAAERMRALLEPGRPCPVCGSSDHPLDAEGSPWASRLEDDRARVAELQSRLEELQASIARADAGREAALKDSDRLRAEIGECDARAGRLHGAWQDARLTLLEQDGPAVPESPQDPGALAGAHAARSVFEERVRARQLEIEQFTAADQRLVTLESAIRDAADREGQFRRTAADARAVALQASGKAAEARASLAEKRRSRDELRLRLAPILDPVFPGWAAQSVSAPDAFVESCRAKATAVIDARTHLAAATSRVLASKEAVALALQNCASAERAVESRAADLEQARSGLAELERDRAGVLAGRNANDVRAEHQRAITAAGDLAAEAAQKLARAGEELATVRSDEANAATEHERWLAEKQAADAELAGKLASAELTREDVEEAMAAGESALAAREKKLADVREALTRADATLRERRRASEAHAESGRPATGRDVLECTLPLTIQQLEEAAAKQNEHRMKQQGDDEAREAAAALLAALEAHRTRSDVWRQLDSLIGSSDGARFRRLAQTLTLAELLRVANHHLRDLAPRYVLEQARGELALQVVDHDMGDEVRGLHNLSGGERFLAALALALGLASMSCSQGIRVDSLFIDEGFGALDASSLGLAVSALESLRATGRRVGVISHLAELKERIPVQVRVVPRGGGRSEVEVAAH